MTDADRLREAADAGQAYVWVQGRDPQFITAELRALLRAMADDLEIGLYIVGAESPAAALALADVILEGQPR